MGKGKVYVSRIKKNMNVSTKKGLVVGIAEICFRQKSMKLAVYENMPVQELKHLIEYALFEDGKDSAEIFGFLHPKTKTFFSITLAAAFPTLFQPNHTYELIVEKQGVKNESKKLMETLKISEKPTPGKYT